MSSRFRIAWLVFAAAVALARQSSGEPFFFDASQADRTSTTLTQTDIQVLETVLGTSKLESGKRIVAVAYECDPGEKKPGLIFASKQDSKTTEPAKLDFFARNAKSFRLKERIDRPGIVIVGHKTHKALLENALAYRKAFPGNPDFNQFWLPGYNAAKDKAFVAVFWNWAGGSWQWSYLLEKKDGDWKIIDAPGPTIMDYF